MRDLIVSLIIVGLFPACFRRPFVGLCVFTWLAYMRVQDLTWHFARGIRWSYYVAILMLVGFFLSKDRTKRFFLPDPRNYLMIFLALIVGVGFAVSEEPSMKEFNERNQIQGKFGQAKQGYGLNNIKAKLSGTSHSWIGAILFVTNLVKFAELHNFQF